jgi:hypothetical protein
MLLEHLSLSLNPRGTLYRNQSLIEITDSSGNLRDDLRFAYAACAPDVERHTLADKRKKRFVKHGWFHGLSLKGELRREAEGANCQSYLALNLGLILCRTM